MIERVACKKDHYPVEKKVRKGTKKGELLETSTEKKKVYCYRR